MTNEELKNFSVHEFFMTVIGVEYVIDQYTDINDINDVEFKGINIHQNNVYGNLVSINYNIPDGHITEHYIIPKESDILNSCMRLKDGGLNESAFKIDLSTVSYKFIRK